jgi:hypothetical protein
MKRLAATYLFLSHLVLLTGCGSTVPDVPTLTRIDAKTELDGLRNHMVLYAVNGTFDADDFATICRAIKSDPVSSGFNYAIVFDDSSNAAFPNTPFTSMYGLEDDRMSHILATYEYNAANRFSESRVYDPNMWSGKPTVTKP